MKKLARPDIGQRVLELYLSSSFILEATKEALEAWERARQDGINILQLSRPEATNLILPPGHPRDDVLYVRHPANPNVYYIMASFHRMTFEHNFCEACELLMHLGAKSIKVEHIRGWSRDFAARLSVPISNAGIDATGHSSNTKEESLLFEATLAGSVDPVLPESLVWYPHEPTWQTIAKARMSFGLTQFSLMVNYEEDLWTQKPQKNGELPSHTKSRCS